MYKVGDVNMEIYIKNGKVQHVNYDICFAIHNNANPQLCGSVWQSYSADIVPEEVRNAVNIRTYHFM